MGNPIFWRLALGNTGILFLSVLACFYSILQLGTLSSTARAVLDIDHQMIGYQEALTDSFLSEVRYGGKYIFTHAEDRHQQFDQFKNDFARYLAQLKSLADSDRMLNSLAKIDQFHRQYHDLFDREVAYIRGKQPYAQSRYQQERDKVLESMMSELNGFKALLQTNLHDKLESLDRNARTARRIAIAGTLIVTLFGTWFSFRIARRLTVAHDETSLPTETESRILGQSWSKRVTVFAGNILNLLRRGLAASSGVVTRKGQ